MQNVYTVCITITSSTVYTWSNGVFLAFIMQREKCTAWDGGLTLIFTSLIYVTGKIYYGMTNGLIVNATG